MKKKNKSKVKKKSNVLDNLYDGDAPVVKSHKLKVKFPIKVPVELGTVVLEEAETEEVDKIEIKGQEYQLSSLDIIKDRVENNEWKNLCRLIFPEKLFVWLYGDLYKKVE